MANRVKAKTVKEEIAELRKRIDELETKLVDPLPDYVAVGQVVRFQKKFESWGKAYTFVALKAKYATWYLTGEQYNVMTDARFREFLADAEKIELATSWERLDAQD